MRRLAPFALVACALVRAQCPDGGGTVFYRTEQGVQGYRLLGKDSYWSLFVGGEFKTAGQEGSTQFWMDGCFLEWDLISMKDFIPSKGEKALDPLEAFYRYESGYLRKMAKQRTVGMKDFQDYTPFLQVGPDGISRTFKIWTARMGNGRVKVTQYWIATIRPQGAAVLSVIPWKLKGDQEVKLLIDSYIANFGTVSPEDCKTLSAGLTKKP